MGTLALLVEKPSSVKAPPGSQNVVVVGEQQIGPQTAPASGEVSFTALLDPRSPKVTLQSVDDVGQRSVSELPLSFDAPSPVLLMPLPEKLPTGSPLTVYAAAFNAEGQAWSGAAPELDGYGQGRVEGQGVFSWRVTTPAEPGPWTLKVSTEEGEDSLTRSLIRPALALQLSSDPPTLGKDSRDVAVTVNIKGPDGQAITGLKPRFTAEGASASGSVKDNGDGTYTQRYRVNSGAERAEFRATLPPATTGLPPARIVAWPSKSALPADGSAQIEISVVVVDALGLPVPNQTVELTAPMGDGAIPPEVRTDKEGVATLSYRAGTQVGPALVRVDAGGVVGELVLWQHAPDATPPQPSLVGDALAREGTARWQAARPSLAVVRVGVDVGPPAALTVRTVPEYTTPGAAILVQVKVFDASGKVSPGVPPAVSASVGTVGAVTDNGDGSYNVPVQLPPGVDGPLTLDVRAGDARGAASLPTLASMGGPSAVVADSGASGGEASAGSGGRDSGGRDSGGRDSGGRDNSGRAPVASSGDEKVKLRVVLTDTWLQHESTSAGDAEAPVSASIQRPLPFGALGAGVDLVAHPTGGPFGVDLRARGAAYRYALGAGAAEEVLTDSLYTAALGVRYSPGPGNTARPYLGLAAGVADSLAFTYADSAKASASPQNLILPGLVVNAGLNVDTPKVDVAIQLSELLGPKPTMSHAGLLLDLAVLPGAASLTLGVEADLQHFSAEVGPAATEVSISSLRAAALGGLAFSF
ncbi:MAG: Ig-like domain-containing protein [Alphaproteobacteria bacterium]|nr:Ig-like domain-containing protein [Alphaproteobacteria bacterium]